MHGLASSPSRLSAVVGFRAQNQLDTMDTAGQDYTVQVFLLRLDIRAHVLSREKPECSR